MDQDQSDDIGSSSASRLAAMFNAAVPKLKCQACKTEAFSLLVSDKPDLISAMHYYKGADPIPKQFTQTIAVACNNCGYVMHFAFPAIKALATKRGWKHG